MLLWSAPASASATQHEITKNKSVIATAHNNNSILWGPSATLPCSFVDNSVIVHPSDPVVSYQEMQSAIFVVAEQNCRKRFRPVQSVRWSSHVPHIIPTQNTHNRTTINRNKNRNDLAAAHHDDSIQQCTERRPACRIAENESTTGRAARWGDSFSWASSRRWGQPLPTTTSCDIIIY